MVLTQTTVKQIDEQRHKETTLRYTPEKIDEHCKDCLLSERYNDMRSGEIIRQLQEELGPDKTLTELMAIADGECSCNEDGTGDICRSCKAGGVLNDAAEIAYEGLKDLNTRGWKLHWLL